MLTALAKGYPFAVLAIRKTRLSLNMDYANFRDRCDGVTVIMATPSSRIYCRGFFLRRATGGSVFLLQIQSEPGGFFKA